MTDTQGNTPPIKSFRAGQVEAAIWAQEKEHDGRTYIQHTISIRKRFKDRDGNFNNTHVFFPKELPLLMLASQRAFEFVSLKESDNDNGASPS